MYVQDRKIHKGNKHGTQKERHAFEGGFEFGLAQAPSGRQKGAGKTGKDCFEEIDWNPDKGKGIKCCFVLHVIPKNL